MEPLENKGPSLQIIKKQQLSQFVGLKSSSVHRMRDLPFSSFAHFPAKKESNLSLAPSLPDFPQLLSFFEIIFILKPTERTQFHQLNEAYYEKCNVVSSRRNSYHFIARIANFPAPVKYSGKVTSKSLRSTN